MGVMIVHASEFFMPGGAYKNASLVELMARLGLPFNKGGRDQRIDLHPLVVTHLRKLESFKASVFNWTGDRRGLYEQWHALQEAAGVKREDGRPYGFHDLRRAFATMNADRLTPDVLQLLMQHRDYQTTQRYINLARQVKPAAHNLFVPALTGAG